ncbi:Bacteriophage rv5, Orf52 [uncultured Caudovirales phage]|uniref:Bacteriophage rv5, Orf52 n=1 Tax=uncultured Caudovirales phage TaxID=2100421 RepID=A0A6J5RTW8_9CAUD|nr:Bacteriophage rv5, Orf52 [uncultured Caudovirales phage]
MATTYDPSKLTVIVGGVIVTGFTDGDFITAKRDEDLYMKRVGADGHVARARNGNKSGTIEIKLLQSSPAVNEIAALVALDNFLYDGDILIPISVVNPGDGAELVVATQAWLKTPPEMVFGKEVGERSFVFDCADLKLSLGGT